MALHKSKSEEQDFASNGMHLQEGDSMPTLQQVRTQGSITISPEMFERLYLAPENRVSGELRRTFGNPTPIGLGGFLVAYSPIIFELLGWRGYTGGADATVGTYYFSGGLLAILACIMEWILGNSFPAVYFGVYGGFFLSYGATLTPSFYAYLAYDPKNAAEAVKSPEFLSGLAFWNLVMGMFTVFCTIAALRTNFLFFLSFLFLALTFLLVGSSYWIAAETKTAMAHTLQIAGASCGFITMVIGWYLLLVLVLSTVDFPLTLPLFDLSTTIKSGNELSKRKRQKDLEKNN